MSKSGVSDRATRPAGSPPRAGAARAAAARGAIHAAARIALPAFVVAFATLVVLSIAAGPPQLNLQFWDDAYMFARYADNLRSGARLSWNPGGPPVYGPTSVLYAVLVVLPARFLLPANVAAALVLSSLGCMLAFVALALVLAFRVSEGLPSALRASVVVIVAAGLSLARVSLNEHATSGMDTAFAMAYLTGYLLVARAAMRSGSVRAAVGLGVVGGLAAGVRPDLLVFTVGVPAVLACYAGGGSRRAPLYALASTAGVLFLWLGGARLYFHSALPLSFYAKATGLYRDFAREKYAGVPATQALAFAREHALLILLAAASLGGREGAGAGARRAGAGRGEAAGWGAVSLGALVSGGLFAAYYLTCVLQIMYHAARFYQPILPALVLGAALGARRILALPWVTGRGMAAPVLVSLGLGAAAMPAWAEVRRAFTGIRELDVGASARELYARRWVGLEAFSRLPDDLVIATTEVGHAAALNPRKVIVDYAGLNDPDFALQPFSAERLLARRPDVLYLPHPDYRGMTADILASPAFRADYEYHPREELSSTLGVALRRASPFYPEMRRILGASAGR